jgi:hypothetical protein
MLASYLATFAFARMTSWTHAHARLFTRVSVEQVRIMAHAVTNMATSQPRITSALNRQKEKLNSVAFHY